MRQILKKFSVVILIQGFGLYLANAWAFQANILTPSEVSEGWVLLFDGQTLEEWSPRGDARWEIIEGTISPISESGRGVLATSNELVDFMLKVEFWIDDTANSGIFLRSPTTGQITQKTAYEVNIFDEHDSWPTGSINEVGKIAAVPNTVNKWNQFEISAVADRLTVKLNGKTTVDVHDERHTRGVLGLQYNGSGNVKFRNLKVSTIG